MPGGRYPPPFFTVQGSSLLIGFDDRCCASAVRKHTLPYIPCTGGCALRCRVASAYHEHVIRGPCVSNMPEASPVLVWRMEFTRLRIQANSAKCHSVGCACAPLAWETDILLHFKTSTLIGFGDRCGASAVRKHTLPYIPRTGGCALRCRVDSVHHERVVHDSCAYSG